MTDHGWQAHSSLYLQGLPTAGGCSAKYFATSSRYAHRPESYLRLHSVTPGEGLIGRVWQTGQIAFVNDLSEVPELAKLRGSAFGAASASAAALSYAKQDLGVLVLPMVPWAHHFAGRFRCF
jgi:hypothetical protein